MFKTRKFSGFDVDRPALNNLANKIGTPFFLLNLPAAVDAYQELSQGANNWERGFYIAYSLKTNPMRPLLDALKELNALVEVVSSWEYSLARRCGFEPSKIVFNGPLKDKAVLERAILEGVGLINIDELSELQRIEKIAALNKHKPRIGIRVCPEYGQPASRFGIQIKSKDLESAMELAKESPHLELCGIHLHFGTQLTNEDRDQVINTAIELWQQYSLKSDILLDVGGGFPFEHGSLQKDQPFSPADLFKYFNDRWPDNASQPKLILEPGRWIAAPSLSLVTRVLYEKERSAEPAIIVVDGGTNHNIMGAFYEHLWEFEKCKQKQGWYRICGPLCMENDIMSGPRNGSIPESGSLAIMHNSGAYSVGLSRTFIQPRPPIVCLTDNDAKVIVKREDLDNSYPEMLLTTKMDLNG